MFQITDITGRDRVGQTGQSYQYTYDSMDNITARSTEHGAYGYTYDDLYRLTSADNPALADESYTYDAVGNRLTSTDYADWTYNGNNELLGYDAVSYLYDDNGNMVSRTVGTVVMNFIYNEENRLVKVETDQDVVIAEYYYDPFGRRLWKDIGGVKTYFLYSDEGLVGEYDSSGNEIKTYGWQPNSIWSTDPLFMKQNGSYYYYRNDHLGTPVQMTDKDGLVVWQARYDAFGKATVGAGSTIFNNLRFPGQYYDSETGLHYNWHRYYDPSTGRYLTPDPVGFEGGDVNLFLYVGANPINIIDPYGLYSWMDFGYDAANVAAGFGDTISFGLTDWVRDRMGTNTAVNKCSGMYSAGEWSGIAYGFAAGGAAGWRGAGRKALGKEFSHYIPARAKNWPGFNTRIGKRFLKSGNKWNGNYVTSKRHYYHDPYRYPKGWRDFGPKWPMPIQQIDRIPNVIKGAGIGGGMTGASARSRGNDCECQ